jgi:acetoin utilization deacetylase AcuC-like enzyme/GNAT superfamily N-acetyltransferase
MFRVRRIHDDVLPVNRAAIREVQQILAEQFAGLSANEIAKLPERLRHPGKPWSPVLFVAENARRRVLGFALAMSDPALKFAYLEYLATAKSVKGRGVGAALYEQVRDETLALGACGLFFECLPDDADRSANPDIRKQNAARLRFYETYGARPIINTAYETPCKPGQTDNLPFLMFDDLDRRAPLRAADARRIVAAILERKYAHLCPPGYIPMVMDSIQDDPVRLRPPRYHKQEPQRRPASIPARERMALTINDRHSIHHIRERGYVEAPVRIKAIRGELEPSGLVEPLAVRDFPDKHILAVHDSHLVSYLRKACASVPEGKSIYPYVFPVRNVTRAPKDLSVRAGYYCIDTFTPINRNAFPAAKRAVDCTLTAADEVLRGRRVAYALVRPPGHHAESRLFGGFCYFNNAAIAAQYLCPYGRVAILDIDYHHGNGQQEIFYNRDDVLTVSIHGDPDFAYPYFTGFASERGSGAGLGHNLNIVLPEVQDGPQYRQALERALAAVRKFKPVFLIVALGLDPAKGDPTGSWLLLPRDFEENGRMIGALRLPTLVVQEGGYRTRTLGTNARRFFQGLMQVVHPR